MTDKPENTLNLNDFPEIPLLTGVLKDETGSVIYGPLRNVVSQTLETLPNFLIKELVPSLQKIVPTIGSVSNQFVPEAFGKYLNPFVYDKNNNNSTTDEIAKISEALNDAIFNVPAFLTVKNWSKKTKSYLYSFDHESKMSFGSDFLHGLPLVTNSAANGLSTLF